MGWDLNEALAYYQRQGAPNDQAMRVNLLKEIQQENGGSLPAWSVGAVAEAYHIKPTFLAAILKRFPSLRIADTHRLELCGGVTCSRCGLTADRIKKTCGTLPAGLEIRQTGCMHNCGKGPCIKWDGVLYPGADEALILKLMKTCKK